MILMHGTVAFVGLLNLIVVGVAIVYIVYFGGKHYLSVLEKWQKNEEAEADADDFGNATDGQEIPESNR
ncbi:DUF3149 domain-containing protein [Caenorhabditis elegans]|uniref:DUF3149 domain-containing protein n=1 Tax=Caenorhabditis elegans TaxID=6239 RepID=F9UKU3_CAEEL|nr:DUF3149 domain-containing protein [Caenorhabditis elegans]CCC42207.1 DUF3149 domain-containing protein [Caenorhabditis elegans]|eukprot:NP_001256797.1 Uncharacterized protein CELE_Y51A2B.16 [Caenorhabditis elegans]